MKTLAITTALPPPQKKRRFIRPPYPHPQLMGNQWVAEIDGDIVPVGQHFNPEAALLAARYLACNDDDVTALVSPDGSERYI